MTVLDWAIVAFTLALALWGYRQGLIVGALTLVGFGVGAFLGSRLGPVLLSQGSDSPYAPLCGAVGALLVGALAAVMLEGVALALRRGVVRRPLRPPADGGGGAAAGVDPAPAAAPRRRGGRRGAGRPGGARGRLDLRRRRAARAGDDAAA